DESEQSAGARGGETECVGESLARECAELARGRGRAEHADGGGRMKSALAQVGMAGAADRDHRLVAGDDRLHQRLAVAAPRTADCKRRRYDDAARMHRALAEAIVELDAVGGGAAEEGGIDEVGAPRAAGHRNTAGRP